MRLIRNLTFISAMGALYFALPQPALSTDACTDECIQEYKGCRNGGGTFADCQQQLSDCYATC
jgi:hypothetical protein